MDRLPQRSVYMLSYLIPSATSKVHQPNLLPLSEGRLTPESTHNRTGEQQSKTVHLNPLSRGSCRTQSIAAPIPSLMTSLRFASTAVSHDDTQLSAWNRSFGIDSIEDPVST